MDFTYEQIRKYSEDMKTIPFTWKQKQPDGTFKEITKKYPMVNERVIAFRKLIPNGTIETELLGDKESPIGIKCEIKAIIRDENGRILSTGIASEVQGNGINKTSYIENCETSAVGRALAFLGFGIEESIASAEEIIGAEKGENKEKDKEIITSKQKKITKLFKDAIKCYGSNQIVYNKLGIEQEDFKKDLLNPSKYDEMIEQFELILEEEQKGHVK